MKTNTFNAEANTFKTKSYTFKVKTYIFKAKTNTFKAETNTSKTKSYTFKVKIYTFKVKTKTFKTKTNTFEVMRYILKVKTYTTFKWSNEMVSKMTRNMLSQKFCFKLRRYTFKVSIGLWFRKQRLLLLQALKPETKKRKNRNVWNDWNKTTEIVTK